MKFVISKLSLALLPALLAPSHVNAAARRERQENESNRLGRRLTKSTKKGGKGTTSASKIDVCTFPELKSVKASSSLATGEDVALPGDSVEDVENFEFDEDCSLKSTMIIDARFGGLLGTNWLDTRFTVYEDSEGNLSGKGGYIFAGNGNVHEFTDITFYCINGNSATVVGPVATLNGVTSATLLLTILDNGDDTFSTRALLDPAQALQDSQCNTSPPPAPATGAAAPTSFLVIDETADEFPILIAIP